MSEPFATSEDLKDRWPSFPEGDEFYVDTLMLDASNMVRERWPNVDDRVLAGTLQADSLTRIVCTMVKTAILNSQTEGVESISVATGPFSDTRKFTNPNGNLYFAAEMIRLLDGYQSRRAFAVDLFESYRPSY